MEKKISDSASQDFAKSAGAYFLAIKAASDSAAQAAELLHSKTRFSAKERLALLERVETCQALTLLMQREYHGLMNEITSAVKKEARAEIVPRLSDEVTRRALTEALELAPYLLTMRLR